ncbi:TonB-dependent receptor plug domain-containing protein [Sphingomonas edaphi]|nr:TonB-dependent receptor [Sphingomonas edaphi]
MPDLPLPDQPAIVVTASRSPETVQSSFAGVTVIHAERIERLGSPLAIDVIRLAPSAAVSESGPTGSQAQLRIRGAEANHSLLFVDGIRANDPAAGNEPRFELLNADLADRITLVRGPQSALWGSEAIGGVVSVDGKPAGTGTTQGQVEAGSHSSWRASLSSAVGTADRGLAFGLAGQGSDGVDAYQGDGERDGYRNLSMRASGRFGISPAFVLGGSAFATAGYSQFDGYDPDTFQRADTLDESRNRIAAGRLYAEYGRRDAGYAALSASLLGSSNRNMLDGSLINKSWADRRSITLESGYRFGKHRFIAALETETEKFHARDENSFGLTNQDRSRRHHSLTAEWRGGSFGPISADVAVRHDQFSRFKDATSLRAAMKVNFTEGMTVIATYGEGIAQPTFFDLYGYFPGFFVGNPSLRPEKSRGWEIAGRVARGHFSAAATYFHQRLKDEIVDSSDFSSTLNANGVSRRHGVEFEANWAPSPLARLSANYSYLDATERKFHSMPATIEQRRPKHSGSISADGEAGRWTYGASLTFVGRHRDRRDSAPYDLVNLQSYWLANARAAYAINETVQLSVRLANMIGNQNQDLVGYRTEGRTIHAGLRFALDR